MNDSLDRDPANLAETPEPLCACYELVGDKPACEVHAACEICHARASVAPTEVGLRCCGECRELFGFAAEAEVLPF